MVGWYFYKGLCLKIGKKNYSGAEMTGSMQKEPNKLFRQQVARI